MKSRIEIANLDNPADAGALVEILDSFARGPGGQNESLSAFARDNLVRGLREHPGATVFFVLVDDRPVGAAVCMLTFSTFAAKTAINVHDLSVLPEFRGNGLGRALLAEVEAFARSRGYCKVTLEVHDSNDGAKKFYRELGFGPWDRPTLSLYKDI